MKEEKEELIVHWSNWASQPTIMVSCSKLGYTVQPRKEHLPTYVCIALGPDDKIINYSFDTREVTCEECKRNKSFINYLEKRLDYDERLKESGLSEDDYIESLIKIRKNRKKKNERVKYHNTCFQ